MKKLSQTVKVLHRIFHNNRFQVYHQRCMTSWITNSSLEKEQIQRFFTRDEHHFYSINTVSVLGRSFLCTYLVDGKRACKPRTYLVRGDKCIKLRSGFPHTHGDKLERYKENEMKRRCGLLETFMSTKKITVKDIFKQVLLE